MLHSRSSVLVSYDNLAVENSKIRDDTKVNVVWKTINRKVVTTPAFPYDD